MLHHQNVGQSHNIKIVIKLFKKWGILKIFGNNNNKSEWYSWWN